MVKRKKEKRIDSFQDIIKRNKGIGPEISLWVCKKLGINPMSAWDTISRQKKEDWEQFISLLRRKKQTNFTSPNRKKMKEHLLAKEWPLIDESLFVLEKTQMRNRLKIKHKRAIRIKQGYPGRGQRTRSNAQTSSKLNRSR